MSAVLVVLFWLCVASIAANILVGLLEWASTSKASTPWRLSQTAHDAALRGIGYIIAAALLATACKP